MGYQILKQPDTDPPQFAIFSSFTDTVIIWDATDEEIVEWFAEAAAERARSDARRAVAHVAAGDPRRVYHQFAMTWAEALEMDREHGGTAHVELSQGAPGE
jgi:hypothetical protein